MRKIVFVFLVLVLATSVFAGQGEKKDPKFAKYPDGTTIEIPYDSIREASEIGATERQAIVLNDQDVPVLVDYRDVEPKQRVYGTVLQGITRDAKTFIEYHFIPEHIVCLAWQEIADDGSKKITAILFLADGTALAGDNFLIAFGNKKTEIVFKLFQKGKKVASRRIKLETKNGNQ